jgi:hypothetical protein
MQLLAACAIKAMLKLSAVSTPPMLAEEICTDPIMTAI